MLEHKRREMEDKKRKFLGQSSGSNTRPRYNPQQGNPQQLQGQSSMLNRNQYQMRPQYPQQQMQQYRQQQQQQRQPQQQGPQGYQQNNQAPRAPPANKAPVGPRDCFHCGEPGHYANACPRKVQGAAGQNNNQRFNQQLTQGNRGQQQNYLKGKINHMGAETAQEAADVVVGTFPVNSHPATVLFDSGASHAFISADFVKKN